MEAPNKHMPSVVLVIGLGFLLYSIRAFMHPAVPKDLAIPVKPAPQTAQEPAAAVVKDHLNAIKLKIELPSRYEYILARNSSAKILIGTNDRKAVVYLFSMRGEYDGPRAQNWLHDFFSGSLDLQTDGGPQRYADFGGMTGTVLIRGQTKTKSQFTAFFFKDMKTGFNHVLFVPGPLPDGMDLLSILKTVRSEGA